MPPDRESQHIVTSRGERRQQLRAQLFSWGSWCEFPDCNEPATQMAHLHSIGMGGRASADTIENVMRACNPHALLTDQAIPGDKGAGWYYDELAKLGIDRSNVKAWVVAEALREHIAKHRPG